MKLSKIFFVIFLFVIVFSVPLRGQIITTIAGGATGHGGYWGDGGPATAAELSRVGTVFVDKIGDILIGDKERILKVSKTSGILTTVVGTGVLGFNGDGLMATNSQVNWAGLGAVDENGNVYFGDGENYRIRKIDRLSGRVSTIAGNGIIGSSGDGGLATNASITPGYLTMDFSGNIYTGCSRRIRRITPLGIVETIAGNGSAGATGENVPASSTCMGFPLGVATDRTGNVYYADTTGAVRKIDINTGTIFRVAGTGDNVRTPYSGDGYAATLCHISPIGLAVDDTGNLYIADGTNNRILKVDTFGIIFSIAGTGIGGFSGDGAPATAASISFPHDVALDKCGNVYIADFNNRRVRKITYRECDYTSVQDAPVAQKQVEITPSPAKSAITITSESSIHTLAIYNLMGQVLLQQAGSGKPQQQIDVSTLPPGVYIVRVNDMWTARLVKE